jgi:biopolymer transport protein ExbB/TolQ
MIIFTIDTNDHAVRRDVSVALKIISPLAAVIFLGLYFNHFVWTAMKADLAIAGAIFGGALYGSVLIFIRMRAAQVDFRIIERFGREAAAGASMQDLLEEPWIRKRYVRHYLKHIAQTGGLLSSQLDQNAIESELEALLEDYNSKLEFPQFLVGFMIAMGLLGTFIGLLETLTGISGMLASMSSSTVSPDEQFKQLVGELRKPLAGMGIAFAASMFGLVASLMLSIMMTNLRHLISRVVMCARNVMHDLTQISRKAELVDIDEDGHEVPRKQNDSSDDDISRNRSHDVSMLIASRMDVLLKKLEVLFKSFETSISGTTRLNELLGFGPRMKETGERTLEELRSLVTTNFEQQRIMQQLADSQVMMVNTISAILETQRRSQMDNTSNIKALGERIAGVEEATIGSGRHLWEIKETLVKSSSISGMVEMLSSSVGHQTLLFEALLDEMRSIKSWFGVGSAPDNKTPV